MKTNAEKPAASSWIVPCPTTPCPAPLYATGFDKTDYIDPLLRLFLAR